MKKLFRSIRRAWLVFKVNMCGVYKNNVWDGVIEFCVFEYKSRTYYLPLINEGNDIQDILIEQGYEGGVYWVVINGENYESENFTDVKDFIDTRVSQLQLDGYQLPEPTRSPQS